MPRLIPAAERITRARALIQKARKLPLPPDGNKFDFTYIAKVKDILRQARDLIKFIPDTPSATDEIKAEVKQIFAELEQANREILH
ncbi:MAG TPA: hypothetical protein VN363_09210 [Anaerolineales bacterium]|nr:hypothetical protein [Anaerolineales bacterium]